MALSCLDKWLHSYSNSQTMNVVYTDMRKAFDSVNHRILITILESLGIEPRLTAWLRNFLSNRVQQVCLNGTFSSPLAVLSGVPQGSVIGPFLFLLFINGLADCVTSQNVGISLFADDSKLFSTDGTDLQLAIAIGVVVVKQNAASFR